MTEPAKDEAELLCALVDAIWQYLAPETRWTAKPYVERDLAAAIRAAGWAVVPVTELDALRAENARLREALKKLLDYSERYTCKHEETHRGGFLWEICDVCGDKWADDMGGKTEWKDPPEWVAARAALEVKP